MTDPFMMNCKHSHDGWCLGCVGKLAASWRELRAAAKPFFNAAVVGNISNDENRAFYGVRDLSGREAILTKADLIRAYDAYLGSVDSRWSSE